MTDSGIAAIRHLYHEMYTICTAARSRFCNLCWQVLVCHKLALRHFLSDEKLHLEQVLFLSSLLALAACLDGDIQIPEIDALLMPHKMLGVL